MAPLVVSDPAPKGERVDRVREQLFLRDAPRCPDVTIALLDSGVDTKHPDLQSVVDAEASGSFMALSDDITDRWYHGTHLAGIIAGTGAANGGQYRGIAQDARLIAMKISSGQSGYESDAAAAVEAAIELGVDIINYSASYSPRQRKGPPPWVWPRARSLIEDAFSLAADRGILCVVAVGNDGPEPGSINRPGGLPNVLTVGAVRRNGVVLDMSSRGPYRLLASLPIHGERRFDELLDTHVEERGKPDIVAPGELIVAPRSSAAVGIRQEFLLDPTDPDCPYLSVSGTSQATAVATGIAACLLQRAKDEGVDLGPNRATAALALMKMGARPLATGTHHDYGAGLITWPVLVQELRDFATDPEHRERVLKGPQLRLME